MGKEQHVTKDMRRSMLLVEKYKNVILDALRAEKITCVEGDDNDVLKMLDLTCGIDYYHVYSDGLVRGIASRWQTIRKGQPIWNTFTIRKERESGADTEYKKRKHAIEKGGEYPYLTMQGYVDESDELLSVGFARTADIIECIDKNLASTQHTGYSQHGQASFYVIKWDVMIANGYTVLVHRKEPS